MRIPAAVLVDAADIGRVDRIARLSTGAGVFYVEVAGRVTHLSSAPNLQRRVMRTLEKLARFLTDLQPGAVLIHTWKTQSKLETSLLLYQLAKQHFPKEYLQRVHLRMPWFVGLFTRDPFPRLISANRIPQGCVPIIGPFASRDLALLYEQEIQSAFLLRRCTEVLSPQPQHPGCIYGEMRQCLRPCQSAVEDQRYLAEAAEVSAALRADGSKPLRELEKLRDAAISTLDFESAARIHKQLEKLQAARAARDPVITNVDHFNGLALALANTRLENVDAESPRLLLIFPMIQGRWLDPIRMPVEQAGSSKMLEQSLRPHLDASLDHSLDNQNFNSRSTLEDLALFARWYYSSWREGVWIPFLQVNDLPYRKLVRVIQGLLRAERAIQKQQISQDS